MEDQPISGRMVTRADKGARRVVSRGQSARPRGSIPIHVNGSRDELEGLDPDLTLAELDWGWAVMGEGRQVGGAHTKRRPHSSGTLSLVHRATSGTQPSRARPIKPHETEPFLSVGEIVRGTKQSSSSSVRFGSGAPGHQRAKVRARSAGQRSDSPGISSVVSGHACGSAGSLRQQWDTLRSPYSSPAPPLRIHSAGSQGRRSADRMYVSPNSVTPRPNSHVKTPFKHSVQTPSQTRGQAPSHDLRERTALATFQVRGCLAGRGGSSRPKQRGKLTQKGHLMPMYPVPVTGPSITHCRGILADTRAYTPSLSRSLQHRRRLVSQLKSGDLGLDLDEDVECLADGYESVHRISTASSLEELASGAGRKEVQQWEEEEMAAMEEEEEAATTGVPREEREAVTPHLQHSSSHLTQQTSSTDSPHPDEQGIMATASDMTERGQKSAEETMDISEGKGQHALSHAGVQDGASSKVTSLNNRAPGSTEPTEKGSSHVSTQSTEGGTDAAANPSSTVSTSNSSKVLTDNALSGISTDSPAQTGLMTSQSSDGIRLVQPQGRMHVESRRPQSASVHYLAPTVPPKSPTKVRPRTAASSVKAVRFADLTEFSDGTQAPALPDSQTAKNGGQSTDSQTAKGGGQSTDSQTAKGGGQPGRLDGGSGQSCKPSDLHKHHGDDDDDSDNDMGGGGGRRVGGGLTVGAAASGGRGAGAGEAIGAGPASFQPQQPSDSQEMSVMDRPSDNVADTQTTVSQDQQQTAATAVLNHAAGVPVTAGVPGVPVTNHVARDPISALSVTSNVSVTINSSGTKTALGVNVASDIKTATKVTTSCDTVPTPSATATALSAAPSSQGLWQGERPGMAWKNPPVTWSASVGEGASTGPPPDPADLRRLLMDVSAQVTVRPAQGRGRSAVDSAHSVDPAASDGVTQDRGQSLQAARVSDGTDDGEEGVACRPPAEADSQTLDGQASQGGTLGERGRRRLLFTSSDGHAALNAQPGEGQVGDDGVRGDCKTWLAETDRDPQQFINRQPPPAHTQTHQQSQGISSTELTAPCSARQKQRKVKKASPVTMIMQADHGINPRIGVFACQHTDSPRKAEGPLLLKGDDRSEPGDDDVTDEEDAAVGGRGAHPQGMSLTQLFTHFSLGMDSSLSACGDCGRQGTTPPSTAGQVPGILKKKKGVSAAEIQKKKSQARQPSAKMPVEKLCDDQRLPQSKISQQRCPSSKRFVSPSDDPSSWDTADHLRFGHSPYLQDSKKPPNRWHRLQGKGEALKQRKVQSTGRSTSPPAGRGRRPTKVQFADCSAHTLDLSHSCAPSQQPCPVCTRQGDRSQDTGSAHTPQLKMGKQEDESAPMSQMYQHEGGVWNAEEEHGTDGMAWMCQSETESCCGDGGDDAMRSAGGACEEGGPCGEEGGTEARFTALEAELSAARSQLQQDILTSQTQLAQDSQSRQQEAVYLTSCDQHEEEDDFVYEDYGSSSDDDNVDEKGVGNENSMTHSVEHNRDDDHIDDDRSDGDHDEAYCTYYRALLLDYRQKCMMAGEGNLVISDRLTWPMAAPAQPDQPHGLPTRPYSAGAFHTLEERRGGHHGDHQHSSPALCRPALVRTCSQSDSGWESDQESDCRGRTLDHWNSLLSVDGESVSSGCADSPSYHTKGTDSTKREATAGEDTNRTGRRRGGQQGGNSQGTLDLSTSRPSSGREDHPQFQIKAASIPKPPARSKVAPSVEAPAAPFPPLCFAVTGRAPPGLLFFFTYATYMNPDRLSSLIQRQVDRRYWAVLFGFELAFNVQDFASLSNSLPTLSPCVNPSPGLHCCLALCVAVGEGSGVGLPNILFNPFSSVEGCLVLLTPTELQALDVVTGAPQHYSRVVLPVWMSDVSGETEDCGLAKHCVAAVTYISTNQWSSKDGCAPNPFVASQCLKSADLLTPNYREHLSTLVTAGSSPHDALPVDGNSASPVRDPESACSLSVPPETPSLHPQAVVS